MLKHFDLFEACRRELANQQGKPKGTPNVLSSAARRTLKRSNTRTKSIGITATDCPQRARFFAEREAERLQMAA